MRLIAATGPLVRSFSLVMTRPQPKALRVLPLLQNLQCFSMLDRHPPYLNESCDIRTLARYFAIVHLEKAHELARTNCHLLKTASMDVVHLGAGRVEFRGAP
jgi:hypothetical protein